MLPQTHPLLQLCNPRIHALELRLKDKIWEDVAPVQVFYGGSTEEHISFAEGSRKDFIKVSLPFVWGKVFDQGWFKIKLPAKLPGGRLYLRWEDQGEGTLYHKEVPYYGFDVAHRTVLLPASSRGPSEFFVESLCLQSAIWHPSATGLGTDGSVLTQAQLVRRNDLAWNAWHDYSVLLDLLKHAQKKEFPVRQPQTHGIGHHPAVEEVSVFYRRLLRKLDDAVNAHDTGGLPSCAAVLARTLKSLQGKADDIQAILTGHAHIDLVWLWPEKCGEYKAVHTFSSMNRLMSIYPEMRFAYSQPASYQAVQRRSPGLMKEVSGRIKSGAWEAAGATYVESDTLIACGEALARSFTIGQEGFRKLQGKPSRILWLPDVFGYSACLPQLMKQTGVDYFFTTKLTWCNVNLFPYSSFTWKGHDGSSVLVHVTQGNGYNQLVSAEELDRGARAYRQSDLHDAFLAPTGFGDGGGGVTEEMCERARRLQDVAGMPRTRWGRLDEFYNNLEKISTSLPVYEGELYLEYHRGILTTHDHLKAAYREAEKGLQTWEAARCLQPKKMPLEVGFWERVVFAQFHDYLPGSSIAEVYEEGVPELEGIAKKGREAAVLELSAASGQDCVFNPLPQSRRIAVPGKDKTKLEVFEVPPLSISRWEDLPVKSCLQPVTTGLRLDSERLRAEFRKDGCISVLKVDGLSIPIQNPLGCLTLYPDKPHMFDSWDIDRQSLSLGEAGLSRVQAVKNVEPGSLVFAGKLGRSSLVQIRYTVDPILPVLHVEYDIDWHEKETLLKVIFPTALQGLMTRYGAPFGSILRPQQPRGFQQEAQFEVAGSRYAVLSDDYSKLGLAILTESKYGFSCREGVLGVSLLRSPRITGESNEMHARLFPEPIRRLSQRETFADQGKRIIRLALAGQAPTTPREEQAAALVESLFTPVLRMKSHPAHAGFLGLESGSEGLQATWACPVGQGVWELRLNETLGSRGVCKVICAKGWKLRRVDLSGNSLRGLSNNILSFKPYELITLRFEKS